MSEGRTPKEDTIMTNYKQHYYKFSDGMIAHIKKVYFIEGYSYKDQDELFIRYKNGDERAYEILSIINVGLIFDSMDRIIPRFPNHYRQFDDDIFEEGNIGLLSAIKHFDISRGIKFSTYAQKWIDNAVSQAICSQKERDGRFVDEYPDENVTYGVGYASEQGNPIEDIESNAVMSQLLDIAEAVLSARDFMVFKLHYGFVDGNVYSLVDIAKIMDIDISVINKINSRSRQKIRRFVQENSIDMGR